MTTIADDDFMVPGPSAGAVPPPAAHAPPPEPAYHPAPVYDRPTPVSAGTVYDRLRARRRQYEDVPVTDGFYLRVHPVSLRHVESATDDLVAALNDIAAAAKSAVPGGEAEEGKADGPMNAAIRILGNRLLPLVGAACELWEGPEEAAGGPLDVPGVTVHASPVDLVQLGPGEQLAAIACWADLSFANPGAWRAAGNALAAVVERMTGKPVASTVPSPSSAAAGTAARTSTTATTGTRTPAGAGRTSKPAPPQPVSF